MDILDMNSHVPLVTECDRTVRTGVAFLWWEVADHVLLQIVFRLVLLSTFSALQIGNYLLLYNLFKRLYSGTLPCGHSAYVDTMLLF